MGCEIPKEKSGMTKRVIRSKRPSRNRELWSESKAGQGYISGGISIEGQRLRARHFSMGNTRQGPERRSGPPSHEQEPWSESELDDLYFCPF